MQILWNSGHFISYMSSKRYYLDSVLKRITQEILEREKVLSRYLLLFISLGLASSRTTAGIAFTVWYSAPLGAVGSTRAGPGAGGGSE